VDHAFTIVVALGAAREIPSAPANFRAADTCPERKRILNFVMIQKGFVAIFETPLDRGHLSECVASWLKRFEKVEQVVPEMEGTLEVKEPSEIMWESNLQFRIINGEQFTWIYVSLDKLAMETTGFQDAEISFCLEVLLELPGVAEVVDEKNQRRLEQLEKAGII
jgi:hypothetical protein